MNKNPMMIVLEWIVVITLIASFYVGLTAEYSSTRKDAGATGLICLILITIMVWVDDD